MEDIIVQMQWLKCYWDAFQTGRMQSHWGLALIIAIWVAARFSSVASELRGK